MLRAVAPAAPKGPLYFVPRNARHHLPVYTQLRNQTQYLITIKKIQGHAPALARDLADSLFPQQSFEASHMRIVQHSDRLVIKGARPEWKNRVVDWLRERGY